MLIIYVVDNGFNLRQLNLSDGNGHILRAHLGFEDGDIVIGSVGRMSQDKGPDIFIEAAALLVNEFPNVRFLMVGRQLNNDLP